MIFCKQLSSDTGGPGLGSLWALGPKIMAEVSSYHVTTPVSANSHPLWLTLVPVSENHNNVSLADNCPKRAQSSSSESKIVLDFPSPAATSLWHFLCPIWTESSDQKQILVMFWSITERGSGPTSSLTQVPITPLIFTRHPLPLTVLGNPNQAGKFSWPLPNVVWQLLEQSRRGRKDWQKPVWGRSVQARCRLV